MKPQRQRRSATQSPPGLLARQPHRRLHTRELLPELSPPANSSSPAQTKVSRDFCQADQPRCRSPCCRINVVLELPLPSRARPADSTPRRRPTRRPGAGGLPKAEGGCAPCCGRPTEALPSGARGPRVARPERPEPCAARSSARWHTIRRFRYEPGSAPRGRTVTKHSPSSTTARMGSALPTDPSPRSATMTCWSSSARRVRAAREDPTPFVLGHDVPAQ
jgi:hypothetical protein